MNYPTSLFDAIGIQSAPGNRPSGTGGGFPDETPELMGPKILVNKKAKNGWIGTSAPKFIQDNQFVDKHGFDPVKGTPLTMVGDTIGNVGELFITVPSGVDEPRNAEMMRVVTMLNQEHEAIRGLSSSEVRSLGRETTRLNKRYGPFERATKDQGAQAINDYANQLSEDNKAKLIRAAMSQGFSEEEAMDAYRKMREKEAERALFKAENPSYQLYDIIDSKGGGGVDKREPGNNESAINLAMGGQGNPKVPPPEVAVKRRGRPRKVVDATADRIQAEKLIREGGGVQSSIEDFFVLKK